MATPKWNPPTALLPPGTQEHTLILCGMAQGRAASAWVWDDGYDEDEDADSFPRGASIPRRVPAWVGPDGRRREPGSYPYAPWRIERNGEPVPNDPDTAPRTSKYPGYPTLLDDVPPGTPFTMLNYGEQQFVKLTANRADGDMVAHRAYKDAHHFDGDGQHVAIAAITDGKQTRGRVFYMSKIKPCRVAKKGVAPREEDLDGRCKDDLWTHGDFIRRKLGEYHDAHDELDKLQPWTIDPDDEHHDLPRRIQTIAKEFNQMEADLSRGLIAQIDDPSGSYEIAVCTYAGGDDPNDHGDGLPAWLDVARSAPGGANQSGAVRYSRTGLMRKSMHVNRALSRIVGEVAMALTGTPQAALADPMAQAVAEIVETVGGVSGAGRVWTPATRALIDNALRHGREAAAVHMAEDEG